MVNVSPALCVCEQYNLSDRPIVFLDAGVNGPNGQIRIMTG